MTDFTDPNQYQPRILLVDDQKAILDSLFFLFESEGYEVLAASNAPDGLAIFRKSFRPIELLITDCDMPRMSGLDLARECRQLCPALRVLYVSGACPNEDLQKELQAPNRRFLTKPFRSQAILGTARELLPEWAGQFSPRH